MTPPVIEGTDMPQQGWIAYLPTFLHPYALLARWDRPIGVWLLLFPCIWSLLLSLHLLQAQGGGASLLEIAFTLGLFAIGAVCMRGAGCTINDIFDRKYDAQVLRTRLRPLACGRLSVKQALVFLVVQAGCGLLILCQFNQLTFMLGLASLILIVPYPLMKRITYWPQAWLGLTFNWGVLMGASVFLNEIPLAAIALYAGCFFWTLGYDTIYAHQDKEDDVMIGVKSSAIRLGDKTKYALILFYALMLMALSISLWHFGSGWFAWGGVLMCATHFAAQIWTLDIYKPEKCLSLFKANHQIGWILTVAFALDYAV